MKDWNQFLRTEEGTRLDLFVRALQVEVNTRAGQMDVVAKLHGGSVISFTLIPQHKPQPRPWWQVWRRK